MQTETVDSTTTPERQPVTTRRALSGAATAAVTLAAPGAATVAADELALLIEALRLPLEDDGAIEELRRLADGIEASRSWFRDRDLEAIEARLAHPRRKPLAASQIERRLLSDEDRGRTRPPETRRAPRGCHRRGSRPHPDKGRMMTEKDDSDQRADGKAALPELVPLRDIVDLARHPERSSIAGVYWIGILEGSIQVYGHRHSADLASLLPPVTPSVPIPPAAWRGLMIRWSFGDAVPIDAAAPLALPVWRELRVPVSTGIPPAEPHYAILPLTIPDALALVQRWRELRLLPKDHLDSEKAFWAAQLDSRPDVREAAAAMSAALRDGRLAASLPAPIGELPSNFWRKGSGHVSLKHGRVNVRAEFVPARSRGDVAGTATQPTESTPPTWRELWVSASVSLHDLRYWFNATWPLPDERSKTEPAAGRRGRKPKDFLPKVLGSAAAWLATNGRPETQAELENVITDQFEKLGESPAESTVRAYAREMMAGYKALMGDE